MQQSELSPGFKVAYYEYDFDKDAGAIGAITLDIESVLPAGALVQSGRITVLTNVTSGGSATIQLKLVGTDDVLTATAYGGFTTSARTIDIVGDGTASADIYCTAIVKGITMTIATAALTAGRFVVEVHYSVPGV